MIEATMLHGVRRVSKREAMKGQTFVTSVSYTVLNSAEGLRWARQQVGMSYDFSGALGLAIAPDRDWTKEGWWFCYELAAATISAAGRSPFRSNGHITEHMLLGINP